jgi:hypothetical protein
MKTIRNKAGSQKQKEGLCKGDLRLFWKMTKKARPEESEDALPSGNGGLGTHKAPGSCLRSRF